MDPRMGMDPRMMGMMGGMEGEGPVEEAPVEKEGGEGKPETFKFDETDLEGRQGIILQE